MARQLAARTVVGWFNDLSFEKQSDALAQMQSEHQQSVAAKRAELEKQLAALDYGAPKKRGRPKGVKNRTGAAREKKGKVKAKYRDPKTNETWSGRGRMATWLRAKQDAGEKVEKYLV